MDIFGKIKWVWGLAETANEARGTECTVLALS